MIASRCSLSLAAFAAGVDDLAERALMDGVTSFAALLHRLPGVYPTELLSSLNRLVSRGAIAPVVAAAVHRQAATNRASAVEGRSLLPLPHPLDYEWRFTPDAARSLLNRAADLTPSTGALLMFGTPGLAVEALTLPVGRRLAFLAESNRVTERVLALNRATGSPLSIAYCSGGLPSETADAVILDPPWYLDFVRPMLAAAANACRPGGVVLISLPPDGARPSAEADRRAAIALGRRLGLAAVEHTPLAICYETPFFERNALAAAGIYPPAQWRRGDLVVFKKIWPSTRPAPISSASRTGWTEVGVGRMRLFIRGTGEVRTDEPDLVSLVDGDILPTVSRRDPRRRRANVWTSGNRIFRTDNPQLLFEAAISCDEKTMGSGVHPRLRDNIRQHETLERLAADLRALAALEAEEEGNSPIVMTERGVSWRSDSTNCWSKSTATNFG